MAMRCDTIRLLRGGEQVQGATDVVGEVFDPAQVVLVDVGLAVLDVVLQVFRADIGDAQLSGRPADVDARGVVAQVQGGLDVARGLVGDDPAARIEGLAHGQQYGLVINAGGNGD